MPGEQLIRTAPATYGQELLYLFEQALPGSATYNLPEAWQFSGPLDVAALKRCFDSLVERHEALRTVLRYDGRTLRQAILPASGGVLEIADVPAGVSVGDLAAQFAVMPFDLLTQRPFRAALFRKSSSWHLLVVVAHHSACDAWSFGLLRAELAMLYDSHSAGVTAQPPSEAMSMAEYATRQRASTPDLTNLRPHPSWSAAEPPNLPTDYPRRDHVGARGATLAVPLPLAPFAQVAHLSRDRGTTSFMALLSIVGYVLSRWSGQRRFLVTTPFATRVEPPLEHTVGFLVEMVPVPLDLTGEPTFGELCDRTNEALVAAISESSPVVPRLRGHVSFAVDNLDELGLCLGSVRGRLRDLPVNAAKYDLSLRVQLGERRARLLIEFDTDLFRPDTVRRIADHFTAVAEHVATAALRELGPPVPPQDRAALRRLQQGQRVRHPAGLLRRLGASAAATTDTPAVRTADRTIGVHELWSRAGGLAERLLALGVRTGGPIGLCGPNDFELIAAALGIMRSGAAFMPLDPRDPAPRRRRLLEASGASLAVTTATMDWDGWNGQLVAVDQAFAPLASRLPGDDPHPAAPAYLTHTSGSSGEPKAVITTHGGLANYLAWAVARYGLGNGTVSPLHTSVAFDLAVTALLGPLAGGGVVEPIIDSSERHARVAAGFGRYHMIKTTPSHFDLLQYAIDLPVGDDNPRPAEVRGQPPVIVLGGEPILAPQARRIRSAFPDSDLVNEYGPTETVVGSTAWTLSQAGPSPAESVPIGRPIAGTNVFVVDETMREVPLGTWGELLIGGEGVSPGYRGQPAMTAERFVPDFLSGRVGSRLYRTGDEVRWSISGDLELRGRLDHQVKILGYRVEPGEIEATLATAPGVGTVAVQIFGDPAKQVVAWIAWRPDAANRDISAVNGYARRHLPAHLVPDLIVVLRTFPLTASGKIDRASLPVPASPPPRRVTIGTAHKQIHDAWCAVLGCESIGPDARFFEIGGTSLLLLKLQRELVERGIGLVTIADLFEYPTIHALAEHTMHRTASDSIGEAEPEATSRRDARRSRRDRVREARHGR